MATESNADIKRNLSALAARLAASKDVFTKQFGEAVQVDKDYPGKRVIAPLSLYSDTIAAITDNSDIQSAHYLTSLEYAKEIYRGMFPNGENTPGFDTLTDIFLRFFEPNNVLARRCFNAVLFNLFTDPMNYLKWFNCLTTPRKFSDYEKPLVEYAALARSLYPDEDMFTANIIRVTTRMMHEIVPADVYKEEAKRVEHMAGIYEVDEALILSAEQQLNAAKDVISRSRDVLSELDGKSKNITSLADSAVARVQDICATEVALAQSKLNSIEAEMQKAYDAFLTSEQKKVAYEKQQLVDSVISESEQQLNELKRSVSQIISSTKLELADLNRESGTIAAKIESEIRESEKLNGLLKTKDDREALMNKIDKLMVLNDRNIDALIATAEQNAALRDAALNASAADGSALNAAAAGGSALNAAAAGKVGSAKSGKNARSAAASADQDGIRTVFVPAPPAREDIDPDLIPPVNMFFDETISFTDRYTTAMKAKEQMIKNGAHFHKMFDDVLMAVIENANPYLIGPSGCGKTYMISQIAKILNMEFIDIGYINEEYDILGFQTANGGYSRPNFYRCYKYGKIAFCDELDNGNSRATVKLNSFLSNTHDACYNFPNGERVQRHPNFRIIGAGNTSGNGADSIYNTREKIEESVQQRFTPIYIGYDNEVERAILGKHNDWFSFVELFRGATDAWSRTSHCEAPGIVTTRDVTRIRRYIDNNSFSMEKILDYEFIQTKDDSYLAFLSKYITDSLPTKIEAEKIAKLFIKKVKDLRSGGIR